MRDIIFRAKSKIDGGWVIGSVFHDKEMTEVLIRTATDDYAVNPETVGQFTGLTDKNGKKIFEGDVVSVDTEDDFAQIVYDSENAKFILDFEDEVIDFESFYNYEIEVIGNIYDDPDLLK